MKMLILILAAGLLAGCKPRSAAPPNLDSTVAQKIVLKDVTTGEKPGAALKAGYRGNWSYFGENRTVEYTVDANNLVTRIRFSVGTDLDGQRLQEALELKLTKETGRKVAFECLARPRRLPAVDNLAVTDTVCTLRSATQKLTLKRQRPDDPSDILKYGELRVIFDRADLTLEDTALEEARIAVERSRSDAEYRKQDEQAKRDI